MIPPPPVVPPVEPETQTARIVAAILILSTPISGIMTFALAAVLFGEERLEDGGGLTTAGYAVVAIPAILGVALLVWSVSSVPFPNRTVIAGFLGLGAVVCAGVGLSSARQAAETGDPSIGGPLLVMLAVPMFAIALVLWVQARQGGRPTGP